MQLGGVTFSTALTKNSMVLFPTPILDTYYLLVGVGGGGGGGERVGGCGLVV